MDQFHKQCILCGSRELENLTGYEVHDLVVCNNCSLKFIRKIPSIQQLKNYYSTYVYEKLDLMNPINRIRYEALLDEFEPYRKNNSILDIGCGTGQFLEVAAERGWEVTGTFRTSRPCCVLVRGKFWEKNLSP